MEPINVAIMGAGNIAGCMAAALNGLQEQVCAYGVASRSKENAEAFAKKWHFQRAYGSYEELARDPAVDLVYIATPHAMHYDNARLCVEHGRAVLVEKTFTANAGQARKLITLAEEKGVFLTEAIWTRYTPARRIVEKLLAEGTIGKPLSLEAEFSVPLSHKQRMYDPALAGGPAGSGDVLSDFCDHVFWKRHRGCDFPGGKTGNGSGFHGRYYLYL